MQTRVRFPSPAFARSFLAAGFKLRRVPATEMNNPRGVDPTGLASEAALQGCSWFQVLSFVSIRVHSRLIFVFVRGANSTQGRIQVTMRLPLMGGMIFNGCL